MIAIDDDVEVGTNPEAKSHNSNERNSVDLRVTIVLSIFAFYQSESKREYLHCVVGAEMGSLVLLRTATYCFVI